MDNGSRNIDHFKLTQPLTYARNRTTIRFHGQWSGVSGPSWTTGVSDLN
jgi:hypothetical protein